MRSCEKNWYHVVEDECVVTRLIFERFVKKKRSWIHFNIETFFCIKLNLISCARRIDITFQRWRRWVVIDVRLIERFVSRETERSEKKMFWKGLSCRENISKMLKWCLVVEWSIWSKRRSITTRNFGSLSTSILLSRSASNVRDGNQERYWLPPCQTGMLRIRDYMSPRRYTNRLHGFGSCLFLFQKGIGV